MSSGNTRKNTATSYVHSLALRENTSDIRNSLSVYFPLVRMRTMNLKERSVCGRVRVAHTDNSDDDQGF